MTADLHKTELEAQGFVIKSAREKKGFTQEELGNLIRPVRVSDRSIRDWETGKSPNPDHKQALVELLELDPTEIGAVQDHIFSRSEAFEYLQGAQFYLDQAMFTAARIRGEFLLRNLKRQVDNGDTSLTEPYILTLYFLGHTISIASNNPEWASHLFQKMGEVAADLPEGDHMRPSYLSLAFTYMGEMLRRLEKIDEAIDTIKKAPQGPDVDILVRGNRAQLLGRALAESSDAVRSESDEALQKKADLKKAALQQEALQQLSRALDLASPDFKGERYNTDTYVCFNLCSVHEEYARFYMHHNNMAKSFEHIELAEKYVSLAQRWRIPVLFTKAEWYIRQAIMNSFIQLVDRTASKEFRMGMDLLEEAINLARKSGHYRQLWRARQISSLLDHLAAEVSGAARQVNKMLDGDAKY